MSKKKLGKKKKKKSDFRGVEFVARDSVATCEGSYVKKRKISSNGFGGEYYITVKRVNCREYPRGKVR